MLLCEEILEILNRDHGIELSVPMFNHLRDNKFFSVRARSDRKGLYHDDTVDLIVFIKKLQKDGMKLDNIKKIITAQAEKKEIQEKIAQLESAHNYLEGWYVPSERCRRLVSFLGLEEAEYKFDVGLIGSHEGKSITFLSVFYNDKVDLYKFQIDVETNQIEIAEKKSLTLDGLEIIVRQLIRPNLEIGQILDKDDILLSIFYQ
jgi:DNA-binding transcriptional MerR regulator